MPPPNRRELLLGGLLPFVGIDFIEVEPSAQVDLWVYFLGQPTAVFGAIPTAFTAEGEVRIESLSPSSTLPMVTVVSAAWETRHARDVLHVITETPGDFSRYSLTLVDTVAPSRVDPYFNEIGRASCRERV